MNAKKLQKIKQGLIVGFMLSVILAVSIASTFNGYYSFYYENKTYEKPMLYRASQALCSIKPITIFCDYTGFDTGYGFFAPNVASDFVIFFKVYDENGKLIAIKDAVDYKSKEANIRFFTLYNLFLEKLATQKAEDYDKYLDIIVKQPGKHVKEHFPPNYKITTQLYLYDYPYLQQEAIQKCKTQTCHTLIEIKSYTL